jgi:hypothetical protein
VHGIARHPLGRLDAQSVMTHDNRDSETIGDRGSLEQLQLWGGLVDLDRILLKLSQRENFFHVLSRVRRVEGVHSDMVAWLLDPNGWHRLGDAFARRLIAAVLERAGLSGELPVSVDYVRTEYSTGEGPVDIFVRISCGEKRLALGIENKIDSPESKDQISRYSRALSKKFPKDEVVLAFLTLEGIKPDPAPKCPFACISYQSLADRLEEAIESVNGANAQSTGLQLVRHYLDTLRVDLMTQPNHEIDTVCRTLYEKHRAAWQAIRRRLPSERDELHAKLGEVAVAGFSDQFGGEWQSSVRRDRYVRLYRPAWLGLGTRSEDPIVGLEPQTGSTYAAAHLRISADLPDTDAGDRYQYRVRLRVDTKHVPKVGRSVMRALKRVEGLRVPDKSEFTILIESNSKLPSVMDKPDTVVDWVVRLADVRHVVKALDVALS